MGMDVCVAAGWVHGVSVLCSFGVCATAVQAGATVSLPCVLLEVEAAAREPCHVCTTTFDSRAKHATRARASLVFKLCPKKAKGVCLPFSADNMLRGA